jgi:FG-GAP-like repeat
MDVWSNERGDGHATFADFNGDGRIDIAVPNVDLSQVILSLNNQVGRSFGELCTPDPDWTLHSYVALSDVRLADTILGPSLAPSAIHTGDYNYDGLMDILAINADTGVVELYEASVLSDDGYGPNLSRRQNRNGRPPLLQFQRVSGDPVLSSLEDPVAAAFFDIDESGRQDILVVQAHGTRLIWNNYNNIADSEFFKATGVNVNAVDATESGRSKRQTQGRISPSSCHSFVPMVGTTVKIAYDGRAGREQHVCTQCPQTSFLALQPCNCHFGIRRIANYIEEMAMGGGGGVHSWSALMPNAMAIVWPVDGTRGHWRVAYFTNSCGRQMLGVVAVLGVTLILLGVVITYLVGRERADELKTPGFTIHHFFAG